MRNDGVRPVRSRADGEQAESRGGEKGSSSVERLLSAERRTKEGRVHKRKPPDRCAHNVWTVGFRWTVPEAERLRYSARDRKHPRLWRDRIHRETPYEDLTARRCDASNAATPQRLRHSPGRSG